MEYIHPCKHFEIFSFKGVVSSLQTTNEMLQTDTGKNEARKKT